MAQQRQQQAVLASEEVTALLLPGLVNDIVLEQVLPRLPWYQRPVMMSVSKLWYSTVTSLTMSSTAKSLQKPKGLLLLYKSGESDEDEEKESVQPSVLKLLDSSTGTWRELPPLPDDASVTEAFCVDGCLVSISSSTRAYKLDLPAGSWTWKHIGTACWLASSLDGTSIGVLSRSDDQDYTFPERDFMLSEEFSSETYVSETEFYVAAAAPSSLEYHDSKKGKADAINLGMKLRLAGRTVVRCVTHDSEFLYVLLHSAARRSARVWSFSLWKAAYKDEGAASCRNAGALKWHRMECPISSGDYSDKIGLKPLL